MAAFLVASLVVHTLAVSQKPAEPSVEGAKAALVHFIELSNQQALRSEAARKLLVAEASQWDIPSFGKLADAQIK